MSVVYRNIIKFLVWISKQRAPSFLFLLYGLSMRFRKPSSEQMSTMYSWFRLLKGKKACVTFWFKGPYLKVSAYPLPLWWWSSFIYTVRFMKCIFEDLMFISLWHKRTCEWTNYLWMICWFITDVMNWAYFTFGWVGNYYNLHYIQEERINLHSLLLYFVSWYCCIRLLIW